MTGDDRWIQRAVGNSRVATVWDTLANGTVTTRLGDRLAYWTVGVRNSFLYRWLTREPEPDVVVIDLSETWTVGPFVRGIDWFARLSGPPWRSSRLKREIDRGITLGARLGETRPVRQLSRLLAPPREPSSDDDTD